MRHIPPKGYEDVAFFGRNCRSCFSTGEGNPDEAALKFARLFEGSYIVEEDSGWTVYAPVSSLADSLDVQLSNEDRKALDQWLSIPVKEHIRRWESEIQKGLRDSDGKWIGGDRRLRGGNKGQTE